jgi:hypothetical protein
VTAKFGEQFFATLASSALALALVVPPCLTVGLGFQELGDLLVGPLLVVSVVLQIEELAQHVGNGIALGL